MIPEAQSNLTQKYIHVPACQKNERLREYLAQYLCPSLTQPMRPCQQLRYVSEDYLYSQVYIFW